jgi:hypothetical protein
MSDASSVAKNLRERFSGNTEERLGRALSELLENPLLTGAVGRALDAREKAAQAQEVAMGALNIPSAADIERLTRRLRSVSHRLEGIEDGVHRLDRALLPGAVEARLSAIEDQLGTLGKKLGGQPFKPATARAATAPRSTGASKAKRPSKTKAASKKKAVSKAKSTGKAKPTGKAKATTRTKAAGKAKATTRTKPAGKAKATTRTKPAGKAKARGKAKPARKAKPKTG